MAKRGNDFLNQNLTGKTIVFTGGTDGMGKVAAEKLALMGAELIMLGRNKEKTERVVLELNRLAGMKSVKCVICDLASLKSIRKAADEILETCSKINILINCAGAQPGTVRKVSEDGFELNWAVNHLGPFLLTNLLLQRIKESAPARIVNLSSATEKSGHIDFEDLQMVNNFSVLQAYPRAKLAMNMCTRKMAKELRGTGVTVNALNPGHIKTNLERDLKGWAAWIGKPYTFFFGSKPEVGANRILCAALSEKYDNISGMFIYEDRIKDPNPEALKNDIVNRVWRISKEQVGV